MKKIYNILAAAAIAITGAGLTACTSLPNDNNPVVVSLTSADFNVTLLDYERGYNRDSSYVFEGEWMNNAFYFGTMKNDAMIPNIFPNDENRLEFIVSSETVGFEGVNASSSSRCINIVQDGADHTRYHLEWVSEGESTITFWNGEDQNKKEIAFKVTSKKEIALEGFKIRYGLQEYTIGGYARKKGHFTEPEDIKGYNKISTGIKEPDELYSEKTKPEYLPVVELIPYPLNANTVPSWVDNDYLCVYTTVSGGYSKKERRYYDAWEENIKRYPEFNWLKPDTIDEDTEGQTPIQKARMDWYEQKGRKLKPCDFRERRIKYFNIISLTIATRNPFETRLDAKYGDDNWIDPDDNSMTWHVGIQ